MARREPAPVRRFKHLFDLEPDERIIGYQWAYVGSYIRGVLSGFRRGFLLRSGEQLSHCPDRSGHIVVTSKHIGFVSSRLVGRGLIFFPIEALEKIDLEGGFFSCSMTCWVWSREIERWWYPKAVFPPHSQTFRFFSGRARDRTIAEIERISGKPFSITDQRT
ncbi:hypothetical protein KFF05_04255 [bacterium SCSIO 12827]|nr:hypothetical protein KFF05_04255 [bacterium SCSIO 12827]